MLLCYPIMWMQAGLTCPCRCCFLNVNTDKHIRYASAHCGKYQTLKQLERRETADKTHLKTHEHIQKHPQSQKRNMYSPLCVSQHEEEVGGAEGQRINVAE